MALRHPLVAVTVAAGFLLALPQSADAKTGTLSGRVTDGKLPAASNGRTEVRAIHLPDGVLAGTAKPSRDGAWTLPGLNTGWYVLITSVARRDKRGTSAIAPATRLRPGRTTRMKLSLKRTRTPRAKRSPRRRRSARAATIPTAPVAVELFTGTGPHADLGPALARMVMSDLAATRSGDCEPLQVEWEHRADLLREIALANSGLTDPRSRIPTGQMIDPAYFVRGSVATTATTATWTLDVVDAETGNSIGTETGSAALTDIFDSPAAIAQGIADKLCGTDYRVNISINAMITIPPYAGTGIAIADVPLRAISGTMPPTEWLGQADLAQSALVYSGLDPCVITPGVHAGFVKVGIKARPPDMIEVTWGGDTAANQTIVSCPDAPPVPGPLPIMPVLGTQPTFIVLPAGGGTQNLSGGLGAPGGGWINSGVLTVTPVARDD